MDWFSQLKNAKKSCMYDNKLKRVRYEFQDGRVMVEEYNTDTNVVTRRAWLDNSKLGEKDKWDIELGDPEPSHNQEDVPIKENSGQPFISKRITRNNLEWRIRNLSYPLETYSVTAEEKSIVVRTTNKKYYKKINIPDLDRLNLEPRQENITFTHKFNTLIITYKKPKEMIDFEKKLLQELDQLQPANHGDGLNMDNCKPS